MNRILTTFALTLVLFVSALAGEIPSVPGPPPPPPATSQADSDGDIPSVPGNIPTDGLAEQITDEFMLIIFGMFAR